MLHGVGLKLKTNYDIHVHSHITNNHTWEMSLNLKKNMSVICLAVATLILAETHTCADFSGQVSPALFVTMLNRKSITVLP